MASELRVDTLKDASGANSIGLSYVANGSAKAWARYNGISLTSDADLVGVGDSFNYTSIVDGGTGTYTFTFINSMSSVNWSGSALGKHDDNSTNDADNRQSILMYAITASSFITLASETSA